jgi:predicted  nucleic acid-binding Zn-ribbon protein
MTSVPDDVPDDLPDVDELLALVERLDADNERLRMKALDLMRVMEEVVNDQVAGERRLAGLEEQNRRLEAELEAVQNTKLMRFSAPLRRVYGTVRRRALRAGDGGG